MAQRGELTDKVPFIAGMVVHLERGIFARTSWLAQATPIEFPPAIPDAN